jgi:transporter family protein
MINNNTLITIIIFAWGTGAIFTKMASDQLHPMMIAVVSTLLYIFVEIPIALVIFKINTHVTVSGIVYALLSALLMSIGSITYFFALQKGGAAEVTSVTSLYPVLTLVLAYLFLSEEMSLRKVIGCLLAVASIILITKK